MWTQARGHATELARAAAHAGIERVVVVGGDGTVNEVVTGLMTAAPDRRPGVVVLPAGSSCDVAREVGAGRSWNERVASDDVVTRDLIHVRCHDASGRLVDRYAVLGSHLGLIADAAHRLNRSPLRGSPIVDVAVLPVAALSYLTKRQRPCPSSTLPGGPRTLLDVGFLLSPRISGGMGVAVPATGHGGRFVTWEVPDHGALAFVRLVGEAYRGGIGTRHAVRWRFDTHVSVDGQPPMAIEADGEAIGWTPARWTVVPRAVRFHR
jgi:diacylglycerol kinase family enzyme